MAKRQAARIVGAYPVPATDELFRATLEDRYGAGLESCELRTAVEGIREWFDNLYLIEMEFDPPVPDFDWREIRQEAVGLPRDNWQAPYDEQPLSGDGRRWAFFLHFVDFGKPLSTPFGPLSLPRPTPIPDRLRHIEYEAP